MRVITVLVPMYNEQETIYELLSRLCNTQLTLEKDIIVVDDGSTDNSLSEAQRFKKNHPQFPLRIISKKNGGKGSAVKLGIKYGIGDIFIIQDSDLELDPSDIELCLQPILAGNASVVYGSRRLGNRTAKRKEFTYQWGADLMTIATNIIYFTWITDEPTCYKTFEMDFLRQFVIENNRFDWEPEITAKVLRSGKKIVEVPISFHPRAKKEGKKINWKDGVVGLWTLLEWRFRSIARKSASKVAAEKEWAMKKHEEMIK